MNIDYQSKKPIYEQIIQQFIDYILKGVYVPGDKMPSVRELSSSLHVNPNTIQKVYRELEDRGYIYSLAGKGRYVREQDILNEKSLDALKACLHQAYDLMEHASVSIDWVYAYLKDLEGEKNYD